MNGLRKDITPPKSIEEAAAYWAMRMGSPTCGPVDRAAFEAWRHEKPAHAEAYARVEQALTVVDCHLGHPELSALGDQILAETETPRRPLGRAAAASVAAALILMVGTVLVLGLNGNPSAPQVGATVALDAYETAVGERSTVSLPDGSTMVLNTASRVEVNYSAKLRSLTLTTGQALFEVIKDPARPFVVVAGNRRIVALGTAFDVRIDEGEVVQVTLLEGRVSVDEILRVPSTSTNTSEPERLELAAGEQLIARNNEPTVVATTDIDRVVSWREGRLVFRDEPLSEAVKEINRYSTTQLFVNEDPRLQDIRVSGVFKAGRTASFVLALETVYPVQGQKVTDDRIALLWQE